MKNCLKIPLFILMLGVILIFSSCTLEEDFIAWTHDIVAENYTDMGTYAVYKIVDERFNTRDWYDVWIDDSIWDPALGWSSFEGVYDFDGTKMFYFEPEYYEGYVEWNSFTDADIVGATLRFYRRTHP